MVRFSKAMLQDGAKRIFKWLKKGEGLPSYLIMYDMDRNKEYRLTPKEYAGLYESRNIFWIKNGREPNYVTLTSVARNPLVMDYQNTNYTCCPTSLAMASMILYHYRSESACAKALGTSKGSGTSPTQLIANAPKLGFRIIPIARNSKEVKKYLKKGFPVICHWQVNQSRNCKGDYTGNFGHYGLIWDMTSTHYVVADPAKGVNRKYRFGCLDNANKGYRQNYYVVCPA